MVSRCFGVPLVALLAAAAGAQKPAQKPATLAAIRQSHALELARLSDSCVENKLLNDAGRLLGSALRLAPEDDSLLQRREQLRQVWISINQAGEKREAYKSFWQSGAYKNACADLAKRELKVRSEAIQGYLDFAARVGKTDATATDGAFKLAFEVDPASQALASAAGTERMAMFRHRRPGLAALQLGETVVGTPTDLRKLKGKVVLWRSFSL